MKNINRINIVVVGLPLVLALLGVFNYEFLSYALLSTILTGLVQIIIGLKMLVDEPNNKKLQVYVASVILFFILWYTITNTDSVHKSLYYLLFSIPILLAFFLSYIIYKKLK